MIRRQPRSTRTYPLFPYTRSSDLTQARDGDRRSGRRREAGGVNNIQPLKVSDHATSSDPAVQRQLDRLWSLSPGADTLGLERITRLLDRLGHPQHDLPPVLHVAGTNGKGSPCAVLPPAIDAAGLTAHVDRQSVV